jgi:hypothetical protein
MGGLVSHCGGPIPRHVQKAGASRRASAFSGRWVWIARPFRGPFRTHRSRASCSIYHANAMRSALSVGRDGRILRPAEDLRPRLVCAMVGNGPTTPTLPPLLYQAAAAESNEGTVMIEAAPGWPIFRVPPVKACREDSRGKSGFADCIEHEGFVPVSGDQATVCGHSALHSARKPGVHSASRSGTSGLWRGLSSVPLRSSWGGRLHRC